MYVPEKVIREVWVGTSHSDPKKIEDTFPLAITYMGDPKDASLARIKKYLQDHYNDVDVEKLVIFFIYTAPMFNILLKILV